MTKFSLFILVISIPLLVAQEHTLHKSWMTTQQNAIFQNENPFELTKEKAFKQTREYHSGTAHDQYLFFEDGRFSFGNYEMPEQHGGALMGRYQGHKHIGTWKRLGDTLHISMQVEECEEHSNLNSTTFKIVAETPQTIKLKREN